ncbi:DUF2179 domain-containing protein [Mycoplasmopsis alligatoris]|uniref:DUF2179 domain-containing protein n=1 Tax=Mycoplasmopsis alligatoris A21JP2 TaxID=747682 RepID=D4XW33_9BACT|nr:YitT family protein [Mycoplasmopsis alligatoris]EFF41453.1 conserved hypothetical protein [Mycoplasmopsis alligatoris A21JP2]
MSKQKDDKKIDKKIKKAQTHELKIASRNKYIRTKINANMLYLSHLYGNKNNFVKQLIIVSILSVLYTIPAVVFVQNSGLYDIGLAAFGQSLWRISRYLLLASNHDPKFAYLLYNSIFWVSYFILNIPLMWLAYKHLSKKFAILTAIFIIEHSLLGLIIGFIPGIDHVSFFTDLNKDTPQVFQENGIIMILWNSTHDAPKHLSVFLYGIAWGLINALVTSSLLILEASSGGWDILGSYEAKRTRKDLGKIFFFLNLLSLIIANVIGTYIPASLALLKSSNPELSAKAFDLNILFNPNFISGLVMIFIFTILLNHIFPKYTMVQVQIFTPDAQKLLDNINEKTFGKYQFSIINVIGSYSQKEQKMLITNCMYLDAADLHGVIRSFDKQAFITVVDVKKADGFLYIKDEI